MTQRTLEELCSQVGPWTEVRLLRDAAGAHKGAAFCDFADAHSALYAIAVLDGISLGGRALRANPAGKAPPPPLLLTLKHIASGARPPLAWPPAAARERAKGVDPTHRARRSRSASPRRRERPPAAYGRGAHGDERDEYERESEARRISLASSI